MIAAIVEKCLGAPSGVVPEPSRPATQFDGGFGAPLELDVSKESRQGMVPRGWGKQGVVVPDVVWKPLRQLADQKGYGSLKLLATAGLGLLVGMPEHIRTRLVKWVMQADYDNPDTITPEAIWQEFVKAFADDNNNAVPTTARPVRVPIVEPPLPTPQTHAVTRILDPNITLPPDQRPDAAAVTPKRKAGGA